MPSSQGPSDREKQKQRSRADLLRAARRLIEQGRRPTVSEVADAAGISRATAYRYFSKPDDLVREAMLDAVADLIQPSLPSGENSQEPEEVAVRLDDLVGQVGAMVWNHERTFRALLANSLGDPVQARRGGRRLEWLETVLRPLRPALSNAELERLVHALSLLTGVETLVVLRDVCHLTHEQADGVARWAAQALLFRAIEEAADAKS